MKQKSMFQRSFIFVGNIVLVVTIITTTNVLPKLSKTTTASQKQHYSNLETRLIDRGLEVTVAKRVVKRIKHSEEAVTFLANELSISAEGIYDKALDKALRGDKIDLSQTSTLIALAQSLKGGYVDNATLEKIHNFNEGASYLS